MSQQIDVDPNIKLPIDAKVKLYFDTFCDGKISQGASRFADYIVNDFGAELIPYLKEYLKNADYFHYNTEPKDVTLDLIAYIMYHLHVYSHPVYNDDIKKINLDRNDIQWFVNQYICKLDQYIRAKKMIDDVVISAEDNIRIVAGYNKNWMNGKWVGGNEIEKYGHPNFLDTGGRFDVHKIKKYYEERLKIDNLKIVTLRD